MLRWLIRGRLAAFERRYGYDMSYARDLVAADPHAMLAFARLDKMSRYRKDVPREVYYAVKLTGTLAEDCGPCTQLMITMALEESVDARTLAAIVRGDDAALPEEVLLGVRYARASLAHDAIADELRADLVRRWGPRALVSLAFALTLARVYPTLKYALGHGQTCQRLEIAGAPVAVPALSARGHA